jgi:hypothetical protein
MPKKAMKKGLISSRVFIECGIPLQLRHRVCVPRRSRNFSYLFSPPDRTEDRKQKATDALLSKRQAGRLPCSFARRFAFFRFFTGPNGGGGDKQTDGDDKECVVEGHDEGIASNEQFDREICLLQSGGGTEAFAQKGLL